MLSACSPLLSVMWQIRSQRPTTQDSFTKTNNTRFVHKNQQHKRHHDHNVRLQQSRGAQARAFASDRRRPRIRPGDASDSSERIDGGALFSGTMMPSSKGSSSRLRREALLLSLQG
jgi:hypothetical protein